MTNWEERVLRIHRHVGRNFTLPGQEIEVPGTDLTAFAGAGVDIDGEAHILPGERELAIAAGSRLYLPDDWDVSTDVIYIAPSPLARAKETDLALAQGMREKYNVEVLGIPAEKLRKAHTLPFDLKRRIEREGLRFVWAPNDALKEAEYFAWGGRNGRELVHDDGNQLFVEASNQTEYKGSFRYQAQIAFSDDPRCVDHPKGVAEKALQHFVPRLQQFRIVQGTTHTWNIEAIMATLLGKGVGNDGNELYLNAGGAFDQEGYIELRVMVNKQTGQLDPSMTLARTESLDLKKELGSAYHRSTLKNPVTLDTSILGPYLRQ